MLESALYASGDRIGDGRLSRTGDWVQLTTPDAKTHFRNGILRSIVAPTDLERRIDATIAHYREVGVPFRWMVTPSTQPRDTGSVLLRRGFDHIETLHAMVADPAAFPPHAGGDVTVERIDATGIDLWVECAGRGWKMPPDAIARFREELRRAFAQGDPSRSYFLARVGGVPAGTSSLKLMEGFAHFNGAEVDEAFRGRGVYRAMVLERMRFLRDRGVAIVTNHCVSTTSAPICARLGFRTICVFDVYRFDATASRPPPASRGGA
jgi:ribosomal protein S18 acetylase RimI-like enzyme